jgi:tRNA dimethylallyltransferase
MHRMLTARDPAVAALIHPNDRRRVVCALELGEAGSSLAGGRDPLWSRPDGDTAIYGLEIPPPIVRERIELRTRRMFERGVEDEVAAALAGELSHTARRIHGLQDVSALLAGEIDRDEAIRRLDVRTRQYARRQRSWMRRLPGLVPVMSAGALLAHEAA